MVEMKMKLWIIMIEKYERFNVWIWIMGLMNHLLCMNLPP